MNNLETFKADGNNKVFIPVSNITEQSSIAIIPTSINSCMTPTIISIDVGRGFTVVAHKSDYNKYKYSVKNPFDKSENINISLENFTKMKK